MNSTKYDFRDGRIITLATLKPIPQDEPVVVLRAQDRHAIRALDAYITGLHEGQHKTAMQGILNQFYDFGASHAEVIKEPDTHEAGSRVTNISVAAEFDDDDALRVEIPASTGKQFYDLLQKGWKLNYIIEESAEVHLLYWPPQLGDGPLDEIVRHDQAAITAAADKLIRAAGVVQQQLQ